MKIDALLAQYLYQYKKLSLPGIGTFTLADNATIPDENAKSKSPTEQVSFVAKAPALPEDSLIEYIKAETGKMKALAQADLDSYTALAQQFLNIGKPFYIEDIGTLIKYKDGSLEFTATAAPVIKSATTKTTEAEPKKKSVFVEDAINNENNNKFRRLVVGLGLLATLGLVAGGGYYLYNKNAAPTPEQQASNNIVQDTTSTIRPDSTSRKDSIAVPAPSTINSNTATTAVSSAAGFKYILETTTSKARAIHRYSLIKDATILRSFPNKIQVETKDSSNFTFYIMVPCPPADTIRYKDSLNAWYYGSGKIRVRIAQ